MFDHQAIRTQTYNFWLNKSTDYPFTLNSFDGEFQFSDHDYVPDLIRDLVMSQRNEDKFDRVPLSAVNSIANEFWNGPGSCAFISEVIWLCRIAHANDASFTESKIAWAQEYHVNGEPKVLFD
jgi:hypothetical protein